MPPVPISSVKVLRPEEAAGGACRNSEQIMPKYTAIALVLKYKATLMVAVR